jgi:hypothetical protein
MYALIRQYNGLDTKTQETATRKANAELRPILAKSPGFVSFELIKPEDKHDVVASISVFKTRVDAEASSKVAEDWGPLYDKDPTNARAATAYGRAGGGSDRPRIATLRWSGRQADHQLAGDREGAPAAGPTTEWPGRALRSISSPASPLPAAAETRGWNAIR